MSSLILLAALDDIRAIGRNNDLPWRLPADLKRFKRLTQGGTVLMGRKTAESIGRALPNRRNLVLTSRAAAPYPDQVAVHSIPEAQALNLDDTLWVIGGAGVYAEALPHADGLWLTHVHTQTRDADVFFPEWDPEEWVVMHRETHAADEDHTYAYSFVNYGRAQSGS